MTSAQVASDVTSADIDRAFAVLSRWLSSYLDRRNRQSTRMLQCTPAALIAKTHLRQLAAREKVFERNLLFSWSRFLMGLVSYPVLHPDEVMGFGTSWNYSVYAATKAEAYSGKLKANVWTYKYDSTSITWRAFARYFGISDYPDCIFYTAQCSELTLNGDVVFRMIDGIVNGVANIHKTRKKLKSGPMAFTLRTKANISIDSISFYFRTGSTILIGVPTPLCITRLIC